jgi:hypothetical protein
MHWLIAGGKIDDAEASASKPNIIILIQSFSVWSAMLLHGAHLLQ